MNPDYISLSVSQVDNGYKLSDDGYIIDEITNLDVRIDFLRREFFDTTLKIFGVNYDRKTEELYVKFKEVREYPNYYSV
ncbi:protein of unknown function DUF1828 [Salinibacillus kushneri]|uniref:DUF1828 domain-containing protein n=2 Tax=Salinibacillus kushneri TaxID=237682 RepID=A0A1I0EYK4_9BACI|nr:protein of unknown function DUF1828 [Salinibacillus kushneri]